MKINIVTIENKAAGSMELDDTVFGLSPRADILQRMVEWQRARNRAGTHKTKTRAEVSGTGKKPFRQKGSGNARQGTLRAPNHEGGGRAMGPVVRSHGYKLTKKFRALGLRHALSSKAADGKLLVIDNVDMKEAKTKDMAKYFADLGWSKPLIIGGEALTEGFVNAVRNLKDVDVLPMQGANVYDILRHKELVLTKEAALALQARLTCAS
jgi:large subunit ribosomal protein L4